MKGTVNMKKAVAVSCICFALSTVLVSCGKDSSSSVNESSKVTSAPVTSAYRYESDIVLTTEHTLTEQYKYTDSDPGDIEENGVMPDGTSPLEIIPDVIETAVSDAEEIVSDVIDDIS